MGVCDLLEAWCGARVSCPSITQPYAFLSKLEGLTAYVRSAKTCQTAYVGNLKLLLALPHS